MDWIFPKIRLNTVLVLVGWWTGSWSASVVHIIAVVAVVCVLCRYNCQYNFTALCNAVQQAAYSWMSGAVRVETGEEVQEWRKGKWIEDIESVGRVGPIKTITNFGAEWGQCNQTTLSVATYRGGGLACGHPVCKIIYNEFLAVRRIEIDV